MEPTLLITSLVTLFVIVDPIGLTPIFFSLTQGLSTKERRIVARRSVLVASCILLLFAIFGEIILNFIGISMPAFSIAGGILLFLTALEMLFQKRKKRREAQGNETLANQDDPSVFPLAVPLISGPGSIATVILLSQTHTDYFGSFELALIIFTTMVATYLFFSATTYLNKYLSPTFIDVITRILGMLLAALATQFIMDGIHNFNQL
ncbi:MarC family protein [Paracoccaceae bacterium]|nr:MarC family protein [Paracoccaceae bacterium]